MQATPFIALSLGLALCSAVSVLLARRVSLLAWLALAPLAVAVQTIAPSTAALAGGMVGLALALGPLFRRFRGGMVLFTCSMTAGAWAGAGALVAWLEPTPFGPPILLSFPVALVLASLPLRVLGAPRWLSNPLATTQERALCILHAAGRGSDLTVTAALALCAASVSVLWRDRARGLDALMPALLALTLLAAWLAWGRSRELAVRKWAEGAPTLRVAALVADAKGLASQEDLDRNVGAAIERYEGLLARAREAGARVVVLPEVTVTIGPSTRDAWFAALARWAGEGEHLLIAGYYDELSRQNLSAAFSPRGRLIAEYEKQHPGPHEPKRHQRMAPLTCRRPAPDVSAISCVICADLDYPDLLRPVARAGGLLAAPANDWPRLEDLHHRTAVWSVVGARVPLVRATGHGISAVWDASGRVLARASSLEGPVALVLDVPIAAPRANN